MRNFLIALKSAAAVVLGGAAGAAAQVIVSGQPASQAKGAAISGAIVALAALFAPQPHKAGQ